MLYIPKIGNYLKILTDDWIEKENLDSKLSEERILKKLLNQFISF